MPRSSRPPKLTRDFYTRTDTLRVARELLGKRLVVPAPSGERVSGRIVEVEAYLGAEDRAAHSYGWRRTPRTETMYRVGGTVYVFFVYGMHHQFNVVTGPEGLPTALLVRAVEPEEGVELMRRRRPARSDRELTSGPGKLCKALGIDRTFDGEDLTGSRVWIEEAGAKVTPKQIAAGARIGVAYAGEDALKPWRFRLKENPYVSRQ
ncbi:MAG: DNA-3-methyladenine glycosylase [Acidobacteriota bacterium]|jgi:DNA-3-methyladenine glycosylase|nr:DNA-3-methyladenine glycosylase [Acidobacteriota bacterium]